MLADESLFRFYDERHVSLERQGRAFKLLGSTWQRLASLARSYDDEYLVNYLLENDLADFEPFLAALRRARSN